jgi:hypothetical protein
MDGSPVVILDAARPARAMRAAARIALSETVADAGSTQLL